MAGTTTRAWFDRSGLALAREMENKRLVSGTLADQAKRKLSGDSAGTRATKIAPAAREVRIQERVVGTIYNPATCITPEGRPAEEVAILRGVPGLAPNR